MDIERYRGVIPAFYACYDEAGQVSVERTRRLARHLVNKGVKGLYVGGSSGECIYLEKEERMAILEAVMAEVKGECTIIAHVACNNTHESCQLAAHAESLGVDAIASIPPIYFHLPDHAIAAYWNAISSAAPHTDFIIYNIPQLAGVALSSLFTGGSTLLQYFADDTQLGAVVFWTFGDLGSTNWSELAMLLAVDVAALIYFLLKRWDYNAIHSGSDTAASLGVNVKAVTLVSMTVCTVASALAVSFVGIISFIGLVAPHAMRRFVGDDYRWLLPCSAAGGALLLILADLVSRVLIAPTILPVGAITSFLGAPVFLYLLLKGGSRSA